MTEVGPPKDEQVSQNEKIHINNQYNEVSVFPTYITNEKVRLALLTLDRAMTT